MTMEAGGERPYKLIYWPPVPGRGEFIRLCLEQAGVPYEDVGRVEDGFQKIFKLKDEIKNNNVHFAPPILELPDGNSISQTAVICAYLAEKHGLAPEGYRKHSASQILCTALDVVVEAHNVHHPISSTLAYEEQKAEALIAAKW